MIDGEMVQDRPQEGGNDKGGGGMFGVPKGKTQPIGNLS